ncbi:MBOAT family protein, partial [Fannyhessea vaginae]
DIAKPLTQGLAHLLHINQKTRSYHVFSVIRCFIVVNIGWYFDRIFDAQTSFTCLYNTVFSFHAQDFIATLHTIGIHQDKISALCLSFVMWCIVFVVSLYQEQGHDIFTFLSKQSYIVRILLFALFGLLITMACIFNVGGGFMYANY